MIQVTGLTGNVLIVNADQIVTIEQTPDTVITLVGGDKLLVRESLDQLVDRTIAYRQRTLSVDRYASSSAKDGDGD